MEKKSVKKNLLLLQYDEFITFYTDRTKKIKIVSEWEIYVMNKINIGVNYMEKDENYNEEYNKYTKIKNTEEKAK